MQRQTNAGSGSTSSTGSNQLPQDSSDTPRKGVIRMGNGGVGVRRGSGGKAEYVRPSAWVTTDGQTFKKE